MGARGSDDGVVGRGDELAAVERLLTRAEEDLGALVLAGEAGIDARERPVPQRDRLGRTRGPTLGRLG